MTVGAADAARGVWAGWPAARDTGRVDERLTLLTRQGCHLCAAAREAMARVAATAAVGWREIDVATDEELDREYGDRLPVVLLDGREHGYWRVEEQRLLRDLSR